MIDTVKLGKSEIKICNIKNVRLLQDYSKEVIDSPTEDQIKEAEMKYENEIKEYKKHKEKAHNVIEIASSIIGLGIGAYTGGLVGSLVGFYEGAKAGHDLVEEPAYEEPTGEKHLKDFKILMIITYDGNIYKFKEEECGFNIYDKEREIRKLISEHQRLEDIKYENEKKEAIIKAGVDGERSVNYTLSFLEEDYKNIIGKRDNNYGTKEIVIEYGGMRQQIDHIVVGHQAVFLIETKNYSGEIEIDKNGNWIRTKNYGLKAGIENPIDQVLRHERVFKKAVSCNLPIVSIICLSNEKSILCGEGVRDFPIPVIKKDMLRYYIETYESEIRINDSEFNDLCNRIEKVLV